MPLRHARAVVRAPLDFPLARVLYSAATRCRVGTLTTLLKNAGDAITRAALFDVINKALAGTVEVLGDAASWSVSTFLSRAPVFRRGGRRGAW